MNKKLIGSVFALIIIIGLVWYINAGNNKEREHHDDDSVAVHEIYPGDLVEKIKRNEDIIILDVRTIEEYKEIHLKNSLLLPVQEMSQQSLAEIGLGENAKDKEIYIYCRSGNRSQTAYNIMESLGYTNIKSVAGGMIHWEEDEYPFTEVGEYVETKTTSEENSINIPKISIDKELHDFGIIPQFGGTVEASFIVRNSGTEMLEIGQITTSCSCTSASISNDQIASGEAAILTVVFDPNFHGEPLDVFKRTVFIPTNDPNTPEAEISIQVDIDEGK
jgi:rhodanese-related sulfurtransferase